MRRHGAEPTFGRGKGGPLYVQIPVAGDSTIGPLDLNLSGAIQVQFNVLLPVPPFDQAGPRHAFKDRLNVVPGVAIPDGIAERASWTKFPVERIADRDARSQFLAALDWLVEQLASP
jgi:hypothetical protein